MIKIISEQIAKALFLLTDIMANDTREQCKALPYHTVSRMNDNPSVAASYWLYYIIINYSYYSCHWLVSWHCMCDVSDIINCSILPDPVIPLYQLTNRRPRPTSYFFFWPFRTDTFYISTEGPYIPKMYSNSNLFSYFGRLLNHAIKIKTISRQDVYFF